MARVLTDFFLMKKGFIDLWNVIRSMICIVLYIFCYIFLYLILPAWKSSGCGQTKDEFQSTERLCVKNILLWGFPFRMFVMPLWALQRHPQGNKYTAAADPSSFFLISFFYLFFYLFCGFSVVEIFKVLIPIYLPIRLAWKESNDRSRPGMRQKQQQQQEKCSTNNFPDWVSSS